VVPDIALLPDTNAILRDLEYMTARWHELDAPAVIEVRAFRDDGRPHIGKFNPDDLDEAVEWIEGMNEIGMNIYAVRNPVRHDVVGSAKDSDIVASFFLWADCDESQSANNVRQWTGPKYSAAVVTGEVPSVRVHTYWALEQPATDMAAWRDTQMAIAAHFGSDRSVINPSRIMRVGGTVAYPAPHKQERGYVKELTVIRTQYDEVRSPVTIDQMRRAFSASTPATPAVSTAPMIDTGVFESLDRERTAIQALSGTDWNIAVLKLVGSYVRKGLADGEIHALTDPLTLGGYTVENTRTEVQGMINRTRANPKFEGAGQEAPTPNFDHAPASTPATPTAAPTWLLQSVSDFTAGFVAPEYLIEGVIQRGRLYTLTAPTGSGKTAVMLYTAMQLAMGRPVCDRETERGAVIYMAGENPDDVRARIIATMDKGEIDPNDCDIHFIAGTLSIRQDMKALHEAVERIGNVSLIVVDTLAAYFDGDDSNNNAQMLDFARVMRKLTESPSKPAVIAPAHPVKNALKTNLTPMGGSALLNEVDGNLCLWKRETAVELHWQGKHRGAEFEPLQFELVGVSSEKIKDSKGRLMPTVMAQPLLEMRAMEIATRAHTVKERLLLSIENSDGLSITQRCVDVGLVSIEGKAQKSTMSRRLVDLKDEGLIKSVLNNWFLTDKGKKAVEIIEGGGSPIDLEGE
jgi:hypothetical protein